MATLSPALQGSMCSIAPVQVGFKTRLGSGLSGISAWGSANHSFGDFHAWQECTRTSRSALFKRAVALISSQEFHAMLSTNHGQYFPPFQASCEPWGGAGCEPPRSMLHGPGYPSTWRLLILSCCALSVSVLSYGVHRVSAWVSRSPFS